MALTAGKVAIAVVPLVEWTHASPLPGETLTPCCNRSPFELPRHHRLTTDEVLVTCPALVLRMRPKDGAVAEFEAARIGFEVAQARLDRAAQAFDGWVQCSAVSERRDENVFHYRLCSGTAGHDGPHSWERD